MRLKIRKHPFCPSQESFAPIFLDIKLMTTKVVVLVAIFHKHIQFFFEMGFFLFLYFFFFEKKNTQRFAISSFSGYFLKTHVSDHIIKSAYF